MIRTSLRKAGAVVLTASMLALNLTACQSNSDSASVSAVNEDAASNTENIITSTMNDELSINTAQTLAKNTRNQTVYVFDDASGVQDHATVNTKVTDNNGDTSSTNENVDKAAPVTINVTYYLNGKEISPEDLAGQSGEVKIRFDYVNNEEETITVNGETKTAYVPFTVATGLMLDNEKFTNIEVTNGKLSQVGSDVVALGVAFPGLADSLNLKFDSEEVNFDLPNYFEISADVTDFSLDMSLSVVSSNLLSDMDLDDLSVEDLQAKVNELQSAADQLEAGTVQLQEGTQQLEDNVPDLVSGVAALNDGAATLSSGVSAYTAGVASLNDGAAALDSNMQTLSSSLNTLYETLKANGFDTQIAALNEGINGTSGLMATLSNQMSTYKSRYETTYATAYEAVLAANDKDELAAQGITEDANIASVINSETENTAVYMTAGLCKLYAATADSTIINEIVALNQSAAAYKAMYASYTKLKAAGLDTGVQALTSAVGSFSTYQEGTLCSSLYALNVGATKLQQEGTSVLAAGASTLAANNSSLTSGAAALADGTETLNNAAATLSSGVSKLNTGAITLKDGMAEFNAEGISQITSLLGDDATTTLDTIKEVVKLGNNYTSFTGSTGNYDSTVTFIYKTAAVQ
ncbi:hypothetical protein [Lachnospira pectinoschiza]|uniref:Putative membrane protein n=1 Tax=Lachnospira pectinoschiza TaxID=28052 RepID=A0A1H0A8K7_9FIRM|nr:hypothetical protein [Lachnospira pectinoschiza]SDN29989.1 putative membrane protein [Lachnospira pectinoschiza]